MRTFADRLKHALAVRGMSQNKLEQAAGLSKGHVNRLVHGKGARTAPETLIALARELKISHEWLSTGAGTMEPDGAADTTPPTPPTASNVRRKAERTERDDVEYVDAWFFEALQELQGRRRYTAQQALAAKRFLVWGSNKLSDGDPKKMVLGALEAAKELDETGQETSPEKIFALLVEKNAPPSGPESGAREHDAALEFTKDYIRKESKKALKGFTPKERVRRER